MNFKQTLDLSWAIAQPPEIRAQMIRGLSAVLGVALADLDPSSCEACDSAAAALSRCTQERERLADLLASADAEGAILREERNEAAAQRDSAWNERDVARSDAQWADGQLGTIRKALSLTLGPGEEMPVDTLDIIRGLIARLERLPAQEGLQPGTLKSILARGAVAGSFGLGLSFPAYGATDTDADNDYDGVGDLHPIEDTGAIDCDSPDPQIPAVESRDILELLEGIDPDLKQFIEGARNLACEVGVQTESTWRDDCPEESLGGIGALMELLGLLLALWKFGFLHFPDSSPEAPIEAAAEVVPPDLGADPGASGTSPALSVESVPYGTAVLDESSSEAPSTPAHSSYAGPATVEVEGAGPLPSDDSGASELERAASIEAEALVWMDPADLGLIATIATIAPLPLGEPIEEPLPTEDEGTDDEPTEPPEDEAQSESVHDAPEPAGLLAGNIEEAQELDALLRSEQGIPSRGTIVRVGGDLMRIDSAALDDDGAAVVSISGLDDDDDGGGQMRWSRLQGILDPAPGDDRANPVIGALNRWRADWREIDQDALTEHLAATPWGDMESLGEAFELDLEDDAIRFDLDQRLGALIVSWQDPEIDPAELAAYITETRSLRRRRAAIDGLNSAEAWTLLLRAGVTPAADPGAWRAQVTAWALDDALTLPPTRDEPQKRGFFQSLLGR